MPEEIQVTSAKVPPRKLVIAASHGILAGLTDPGWVGDFDLFVAERALDSGRAIQVVGSSYKAGVVPAFNYFFRNPLEARWLAAELKRFAERGWAIAMVGHSNGTDINLRAAKLLAADGIRVETMILIGSVVREDIEDSGIFDLVYDNFLGKAIAYCAEDDEVLGRLAFWPYARLGRYGFERDGDEIEEFPVLNRSIFNRWFVGGHCGYFEGRNQRITFLQIAEDLGL